MSYGDVIECGDTSYVARIHDSYCDVTRCGDSRDVAGITNCDRDVTGSKLVLVAFACCLLPQNSEQAYAHNTNSWQHCNDAMDYWTQV